jgi:glycosyltransferase involved in cell wall biosynthesis
VETTPRKCAPRRESSGDALERYNRCYECLKIFFAEAHRRQTETVLLWVEAMAVFASSHHTGRFADGAIENIALEIGRNLDRCLLTEASIYLQQQLPRTGRGRKRQVLHIASTIFSIGGHTRTIRNWIRSDSDSQHSLLLTRQGTVAIPAWMVEEVRGSGGELIVLPGKIGLLARARMLRGIAQAHADFIVLHHWGSDVTPVVAFATRDLPPVAVLNHCDHAFWLGSSIADIVVNQREAGARLSKQRRFVTCNPVLPIPLSESSPGLSRYAARQTLGIPSDQLMLLTVGRGDKYRPTQSQDFFRTVHKVLDRVQDTHLYVVGLSEVEAVQYQLYSLHPRIHLCGPVQDPTTYQAAADLYLESFPFGSATALLEAARAGVPVVLPFAPPFDLLATNHGLEDIVSYSGSEEEYIDRVHFLMNNAGERELLGQVLQNHVRSHHTGEGWRRQLANVYRLVEGCKHNSRPIPIADCSRSNADVAMSEWQAFMNGDVDSAAEYTKNVREVVFGAAYAAREAGDYRGAFELLWRYFYTYGFDRGMLVAAAKLPVHRVCQSWLHKAIP